MTSQDQALVAQMISQAQKQALYSTKNASFHTHNGIDSPRISSSGGGSSIGGTVYNPTYTQIISTGPTALVFQNTAFTPVGITWGSNQFTVTTAGLYTVGCVIMISGSTSLAGAAVYSFVSQNGSTVFQAAGGCPINGSSSTTISAIGVIQCAVGDTIGFSAGAHTASMVNSFSIETGQVQTYGFVTV